MRRTSFVCETMSRKIFGSILIGMKYSESSIFVDFPSFKGLIYLIFLLIFLEFFAIKMLPKIFLDLVSPWCGYLKCFTRVGKHIEQKIRITPHLNQKLRTKKKKCRRSKDYQFFTVFSILFVLELISWKMQYLSNS